MGWLVGGWVMSSAIASAELASLFSVCTCAALGYWGCWDMIGYWSIIAVKGKQMHFAGRVKDCAGAFWEINQSVSAFQPPAKKCKELCKGT